MANIAEQFEWLKDELVNVSWQSQCWHDYIPEELKNIWEELSKENKIIAYAYAKQKYYATWSAYGEG